MSLRVAIKGIKQRLQESLGRLSAHQGFRRYFLNTSWMFGEQALRIIAGLFVGIYVARYLGPEQFGVYSYAAAFVALFGTVARMGLDGIVVRDLVNHPQERDVYLGTAFWLKLIGAFLTLGLLAVAIQFTSNNTTTNLYIFIIGSGLIFQSFDVVDFYFQSKVLSKFVSIAKLAQLTLSSVLKLYFIFAHADLFWFVLVSLVDQISLALSLTFAYWRQRVGSFFGHFDTGTARALFKTAWPLILSGIAISLYMRIDQIMIKEMLGEREVGLYSAAVKLSEAWYFVPVIISNSLFPAIVNARKINQVLYHQRLQKLFTLLIWLAIAVAIPMTFFAAIIIDLLFGHQYQGAEGALTIHIWGAVFVFIGVASGVFFTIENYTKKSLLRTSLGATSNVLFNLVLIPRYGINGAAIATVLSQFMANYLYDLFDSSIRNLLIIKTKALFPVFYYWK
jgi:O-antigen/teichoic acid export membrane protein